MNDLVDELMNRWEDSLERGQPLTAAELCASHPELLAEVQSQIDALLAIEANFGNLLGHSQRPNDQEMHARRMSQPLCIVSEFELQHLHASGGLGDVYLATEPRLQRQVAVKFPRKANLSPDQLARFEREAQITSRLNHPGIVPVFSLKQDEYQQPCYVMRYVDGLTLRQRVDKLPAEQPTNSDYFQSLEFRHLLQSFAVICNIVAYAHGQGVIHRDIKPENILLGPFGETLLMDWGLAKVMGEPAENLPASEAQPIAETVPVRALQTREGQIMGTPAYASPEQLQGRVDLTDSRSDIYSLGATLRFMMTGELPGPISTRSTAWRHRCGAPAPPRLIAICQRAMHSEIDARYPSATDLRQDIDRFLAGEPISVVPETIWSRALRTVRRRPGWTAAVLAGVMMAVIAGIVGSLLLGQKNLQLSRTNQQLETAISDANISQQRAKSTADILSRALFAATPEQTQGQEPTVRQLLDDISDHLLSDSSIAPLVAGDTHKILTEAYVSLGLFETAQTHADLSYQRFQEQLGDESAEAMTALAHRAVVLSRRDQDDQAKQLARTAYERCRQCATIDADSHVTILDIYAHVCSQAPNPDHPLIVALHGEAHEVALAAFGANHRITLRMASNHATALMDSGDLEQAEVLLQEIHSQHTAALGPEHPETLVDKFNLMALHFNQGKFAEANTECREALPIFEKVLGLEHHRVLRLRNLLTQTWCCLGNWESAEREARMALERTLPSLGAAHQQSLEARGLLTTALIESDRLDEAQILAAEQYELAQKAFGAEHFQTHLAVTLLFDLAQRQGQIEKMAEYLEHLRGTEWEAPYSQALQTAREQQAKASQDRDPR
jgi:serine/threonine protein kinase